MSFNKDGIVDNFYSVLRSDNGRQSYGDDGYGHEFRQNEIKYGILDWLFDKLVNIKILSNLSGDYRFGVKARSKTAEAEFKPLAVNQNLSASSLVFAYRSGNTALSFRLDKDQSKADTFWHEVVSIPSKDGTTARLQVEVIQKNHDGSTIKSVWNVERFTRKGCEQNYQKALASKKTTESRNDYVQKCLKNPITLKVPEDGQVIGLK